MRNIISVVVAAVPLFLAFWSFNQGNEILGGFLLVSAVGLVILVSRSFRHE